MYTYMDLLSYYVPKKEETIKMFCNRISLNVISVASSPDAALNCLNPIRNQSPLHHPKTTTPGIAEFRVRTTNAGVGSSPLCSSSSRPQSIRLFVHLEER